MYMYVCFHRHNPRWGRHAPTRLVSKRSMSDPDLMQSLEKEELERGIRMEGEGEGDEEGAREGWEVDIEHQFMHSRPIHNVASAYNIPGLLQQTEEPELTFLPEEDITGHVNHMHPDPNASHTEYLSEEDTHVHSTPVDKTRNLQTFLASLPPLPLPGCNTDDGIGENIPTSNSGSAYSSPMYTPPDEESIHMHMSQQREQQKKEEEDTAQLLVSAGVNPNDYSLIGTQISEMSVGKSTVASLPSPASSPPPPSLSSRQQQAPLALVNMPVSHSHRSNSLPHALCGYIIRGDGRKPNNVSPTSSRTSISSLARRSPAVPEEGGVKEGGDRGGEVLTEVEDKKWDELCDDSQVATMTPRTRQKFMRHRRTKSDTHDISGPIKTAQIFSVPERVKEIEEKGGLLATTTAQLLQAASVNQTDSQSCPLEPSEKRLSIASSMSSSSSVESVVPPFAETTTAGDKLSSSHVPTVADSLTRHTSLSPKPSSARSPAHLPVQTSVSLPTSVSPPDCGSAASSLPQGTISQDELVSSLQGVVKAKVQDFEGKKGAQQVQQLTQSGDKTMSQSQSETRNWDTVVKRASVSNIRRPSSEIIFHSPYIGVVEVSNPSGTESHGSTSSTREAEENSVYRVHQQSNIRGLDGNTTHQRNSCEIFKRDSSRDRIHSEAVYNAWAGILPTKDLQAVDLASVLELRQKFESKKGSPKQSNLRRSRSLRDTRLLSPPTRLGGSGRWKQHYSSNASLQLSGYQRVRSSASPPAHSHQKLLSSIKT